MLNVSLEEVFSVSQIILQKLFCGKCIAIKVDKKNLSKLSL